jgi:hypothetical protein
MLSILYNKQSSMKFLNGINIPNRKIIIEINATIVLVFLALYYFLVPPEDFNKPSDDKMEFLDYVYFTIITHTTIGYGVLSPKSPRGKILVICHSICMVLFNLIMFT